MITSTTPYGRFYYGIRLPSGAFVYVETDEVEITDGNLIFRRHRPDDGAPTLGMITFALTKGEWTEVFAASVIDGRALAVDSDGRDDVMHPPDDSPSSGQVDNSATKAERARINHSTRYRVMKRDGFKCRTCGKSPEAHGVVLEVDHIKPISAGGTSDDENLRTLCLPCNRGKGVAT